MPKKANVARVGQSVSQTIAFSDDATVDDVLARFSENLKKGETLHIDGEAVDGDLEFDSEEPATTIYIVPSTTGA